VSEKWHLKFHEFCGIINYTLQETGIQIGDNKYKHRYKAGIERGALTFLPPCIDDYIDDDSIIRFGSNFVEELY
jgi:hypothetical protein